MFSSFREISSDGNASNISHPTAPNLFYETEPTVKLRKISKPNIDYGRNRDLDVEGVSDYIMWYENFQNTGSSLPSLPRYVLFLPQFHGP